MRSLILGSEGFVGLAFSRYLEKLGEEVVRFDIKRDQNEDLRCVHLDLTGIDRAYFLAWDVGGAKYLYQKKSQIHQLNWNLKLMMNVMPQLQAGNIPFLFVSSQLADDVDTVYGATKRLGEVWTSLINGMRIRLWNVYGPIETPSPRSHVVSDFIQQAVMKGRIEMLTNGEEKRQFVHIDDVCRALRLALEYRLNYVCDISSFEWISVFEVARIIAEETNSSIVVGEKPGATPLTPMRGRIPGWWPEVDLRKGLRRMIDDLRLKVKV